MKRIDGQLNGEQRRLLIDLYVEGLDEGNDEKVAKVLQFTLRDEEFENMISRVNSFYAQELGLDELAEKVVELAHEHLPSAFKENEYEQKVLTFGDVAKQLIAKDRVPNGEEETTRKLAENVTPLPSYMSLAEIKRIAGDLSLKIKDQFWTPFFKEANFLIFRQSQKQAAFATRTKRLQKKKENKDGSSEKTKNN